MDLTFAQYIPWLSAIAAVLCGLCACTKKLRGAAAPICILGIAGGLVLALQTSGSIWHDNHATAKVVTLFQWIHVGGDFKADFAYYFDPLTFVMLFVVCGVGTLVAVYAAGYMKGDVGYARFFAFVSLFIFSMTTLVMADNLLLLYLGWEGVGLCSYLLIGFYYQKPSAVAAAKKAFIVNRIGDLGFALGIMLTYSQFYTVEFEALFKQIEHMHGYGLEANWYMRLIPYLLMLGAFGKSAQLPLYVWLPDAMEGPTPVSALIHAATMVTAGVYMIARLLPVFQFCPHALTVVACVGALTAVFAGTIALCQHDIKRIYAYSTISQLGYMFLGVGVLSTHGAVFHLFTHAFFKALLFLTAGSVMHALAGQLDLRKMSGLFSKMPVTAVLMVIGCLALAGFPFTAGFYSKDTILAAVMEKGLTEHSPLHLALAGLGLLTALLTAFYTFRLWFRVFLGPVRHEMGEEHHHADEHGHGDAHKDAKPQAAHEPHEMPVLMNAPLVVLAVGALLAGVLGHHWMEQMIHASSAAVTHSGEGHGHASLFGGDLHKEMMLVSGVISVVGILAAAYFHWLKRDAADRVAASFPGVVRLLADKYYVDEINDALIVRPLHTLGQIFFVIDRLIIEGLVALAGLLPRLLGLSIRPAQSGVLQGYGLGMAAGVAAVVLLLLLALP